MKTPTRIPTVTERATAIELALELIIAATHRDEAFANPVLAEALRRVAQEAVGHAYWLTRLADDRPAPDDDQRIEAGEDIYATVN